jgi:hypothetical protein
VILAKSRWSPAIRREHALAELAASAGHAVSFWERPDDVRRAPAGPAEWVRGLWALGPVGRPLPGIEVHRRSTLLPGHRGGLAERAEGLLLERALRAHPPPPGSTVVATTPWQWYGLRRPPGGRLVFDCADDWGALIPRRGDRMAALYRRIGREADAVVVASQGLAGLFDGPAALVPNGTPASLLQPPRPAPAPRRLGYAGTLSERFDAPLVGALLDLLPGWTIDLYGPCHYSGRGGRPAPELEALLRRPDGRARWHGPVEREGLATALDGSAVLVLPHRRRGAITGDAMKLYDYAARGRPIVSTRWTEGLELSGPPHLLLADGAETFAEAVRGGAQEPAGRADERRRWALANTWQARWEPWARAIFDASGG